MRASLALILWFLAGLAIADGRQFLNGRFPHGKTTVLELTLQQKQLIELYSRCRDQSRTPFIFRLTKPQAEALRRSAGLSPLRFQIYDSLNGEYEAEEGYNYIIRFDENHFEIPHEVLIPEHELKEWETKVIGWAPSPLATATPGRFKGRPCPA